MRQTNLLSGFLKNSSDFVFSKQLSGFAVLIVILHLYIMTLSGMRGLIF